MIIQYSQFVALFGDPGPQAGGCYLTDQERRILVAVTRFVGARTVVEFGVQDGRTARCVLDGCPTIKRYVGIDLPAGVAPVLRTQGTEVPRVPGEAVLGLPGVEIILKDSRELTAEEIPRADVVFIDGGHDYETVRSDTRLAYQIVRPGGAIVWHDYNAMPEIGVRRCIDEMNALGDSRVLVAPTWMVVQLIGRT